MNGTTGSTPHLYALLIGIDCYLPNKLPDGSYYPNLGGCVRDISHVEAVLKNRFGLTEERTIKLTASGKWAEKPSEPREKWPTYENMVAAFKNITQQAQAGDHVYIHYSGHGGRAKTDYPQAKGPNGLDEALVPTDIGNSEARYLRDLELAKLLNDMVAKGLVVAVVLDSCHSGGMTRGKGDAAVRGIGSVDTTKRPAESLAGSHEDLLQVWDKVTEKGKRNVSLGSGWLPEPKGYTLLAACRPSESAYEYPFNGKERNGALTYWLLDTMEEAGAGSSYKDLHDRIVAKVHSQFENQTPQLQGEGDKVFLGNERAQPHYAVNVMQVDQPGKRLLLGAGQAHGLRQGFRFAVYPHGADLSKVESRQALVEISQLGAADSWASITEQFSDKPIPQGAQAVLLGAGSVKLAQKVSLIRQEDAPPGIDQDSALNAVVQVLKDNGWVDVAGAGDQVTYHLAVNHLGEYEIWDCTGQVIKNLRPAIKAGAANAAADVARRLVHLAKYNAIKQLNNYDLNSPLRSKLEIRLVGKRADFTQGEAFEPEQPLSDPGNTPTLKAGEWTGLWVKNNSSHRLNVTILDIQPDWGVSQTYPSGEGDYFIEFDPGREEVFPLRAALPEGYEKGADVIKVFATISTTNFRWLELPSLDRPQTRSGVLKGKSPTNPLEALAAAFTAEKPPTRNLVPAAYPSQGWTTAQLEVYIEKA
ncbi:MAG TPA: caspase family protein [Thermodesulfobacteriota bacterium]|nr:caspase family protein [Thermodesulfobacteriota bacterium]